jgi:hypothetical protein
MGLAVAILPDRYSPIGDRRPEGVDAGGHISM